MKAKLVAFDPGEKKNIGLACFSPVESTGYYACHYEDSVDKEGLDQFLDELEGCDEFVIEDYRVFGHKAKAHIGSRVDSVAVIGQLEYFARKNSIQVIRQPSSILSVAQLWMGRKMPKNHANSHPVSAYLHGGYYLTNRNLMRPRVEQDYGK